jgi:hypothetical protein
MTPTKGTRAKRSSAVARRFCCDKCPLVGFTGMTARQDAWGHANNVRMWIDQASSDLGLATPKTAVGFFGKLFSKARSSAGHIDTAADSLDKARYAMLELEHWLARAGVAQPKLRSLEAGFLVRSEEIEARASGTVVGFKINDQAIAEKRAVLAADLAKLDALIAELARN